MNSRKVLFAILAGTALTTAIGILLTTYRNSSRRKKIADKLNSKFDGAKGVIKETFSDVKNQIKTMDEDVHRMVNEEGK